MIGYNTDKVVYPVQTTSGISPRRPKAQKYKSTKNWLYPRGRPKLGSPQTAAISKCLCILE
ncbi:MAG: hypothetical protein RR539_10530, partial [Clostridium sp.]